MATNARISKIAVQSLIGTVDDVNARISKISAQVMINHIADTKIYLSGINLQVLVNVPRTEIVQPIVFVT